MNKPDKKYGEFFLAIRDDKLILKFMIHQLWIEKLVRFKLMSRKKCN